jgi:hypothetical protein
MAQLLDLTLTCSESLQQFLHAGALVALFAVPESLAQSGVLHEKRLDGSVVLGHQLHDSRVLSIHRITLPRRLAAAE